MTAARKIVSIQGEWVLWITMREVLRSSIVGGGVDFWMPFWSIIAKASFHVRRQKQVIGYSVDGSLNFCKIVTSCFLFLIKRQGRVTIVLPLFSSIGGYGSRIMRLLNSPLAKSYRVYYNMKRVETGRND